MESPPGEALVDSLLKQQVELRPRHNDKHDNTTNKEN
jgi:hypothetical protein